MTSATTFPTKSSCETSKERWGTSLGGGDWDGWGKWVGEEYSG